MPYKFTNGKRKDIIRTPQKSAVKKSKGPVQVTLQEQNINVNDNNELDKHTNNMDASVTNHVETMNISNTQWTFIVDKLNGLEAKLDKVEEIEKSVKKLQRDDLILNKNTILLKYEIDRLDQKSRREMLRVSGLAVDREENMDRIIFNALSAACPSLDQRDIVSINRIGRGQNILVKVNSQRNKELIIAGRKALRAIPELNKIFIAEDLTVLRYKMLKYLKNSEKTQNVHSKHGKIYCQLKQDNSIVSFETPEDIFKHLGEVVPYDSFGMSSIDVMRI